MLVRDITLPTKVRLVKAMDFPIVMCGCESQTIKKAEHQRIDAFELWCWRRLLRVPWTARRSNQSILKEINPEYSLEGLMLKLKLQYFGHLMQRTDLLGKTLTLGKTEGRRRRGRQRMRWLDGITDSTDMSLSQLWVGVGDGKGGLAWCSPWGYKESDTTEWLNWTEVRWAGLGKNPPSSGDSRGEDFCPCQQRGFAANGMAVLELCGWISQSYTPRSMWRVLTTQGQTIINNTVCCL